jgi:hypothetical protein
MHRLPRGLLQIALPALAFAAVLGYLAGHRGGAEAGAPASGGASRLISAADLLLETPAGWRQRSGPPATPGLVLEGETLIAPGAPRDAGLFAGQLAPGQARPLPNAFLSTLGVLPHTRVLDFLGSQAYNYSGLSIPGYPAGLDLYVLPNTNTPPTVVGCYATAAFAARRGECEQILSKLTLVGQTQYELNPEPAYAEALGKLLRSLDIERLAIRRRMRASATPAAVGALATQLTAHLAVAASSLSALEAPLAAGEAQTSLANAIVRARDAYQAMASAAAAERLGAYDESLVRVERADSGIDAALATFALLGYSRT